MTFKTIEYVIGIFQELTNLPNETSWVGFLCDNNSPDEIGEYISALGNSAVLANKHFAYLIWGVDKLSRSIIGTKINPKTEFVDSEILENWLIRLLSPQTKLLFYKFEYMNLPIVMLEIRKALETTIQFKGSEFIKIGTSVLKIKDHPLVEKELWTRLSEANFEYGIAKRNITSEEVLALLDYNSYFMLSRTSMPKDKKKILKHLEDCDIVRKTVTAHYNITNLGAILFAKNLEGFKELRKKTIRIIKYKENNKSVNIFEKNVTKGYASSFNELISLVYSLMSKKELIKEKARKEINAYPELVVRELIANSFVHQDFLIEQSGPVIEVYNNRIEITNPGVPLINKERFLDNPPISRNEGVVHLMRKLGICGERGSGFNKVLFQIERFLLPAPKIEVYEDYTKIILNYHVAFKDMSKEEYILACYWHACLKYVSGDYLTCSSLGARFALSEKNSTLITEVIQDALEANKIKPCNQQVLYGETKYVPYWQ